MLMRYSTLCVPIGLCVLWRALAISCQAQPRDRTESEPPQVRFREFAPGIAHTNYRLAEVPWSVQVVSVDRGDPSLEVLSVHARGGVGRVSTLTEQLRALKPDLGEPLAAVNGDFYARDRSAYAGDPRGLQIVDGDLISAPVGGAAFWIDPRGGLHTTNVVSQFKVTWPDGSSMPFGLNQARRSGAVLYTPSMGASTFTRTGTELVLEHGGEGPWLPLRVGEAFTARVREVRETGSSPLARDALVLSLDPGATRFAARLEPGAVLRFSTATLPDLRGVKTAISGGPVLVNNRRLQSVRLNRLADSMSYEFRSMSERHPRSALGWNASQFFLIQVDGRQAGLSVGMTLDEVGLFALKRLGCTYAMNLDGGVSSTLWANGRVRNSPCAGGERDLANGLVVVRKSGAVKDPSRSGSLRPASPSGE
jgi:hypothetical protein